MKFPKYLLGCAMAAMIAPQTSSQTVSGTWRVHPNYRPRVVTAMAESPTRVYFISAHTLGAINRSDNSVHLYTTLGDGLSAPYATKITYSHETGRLAVAYKNGSIDLIDDAAQTVTRLPGVAELRTPAGSGISDLAFSAAGDLAVGTTFGVTLFSADGNVRSYGVYSTDESMRFPSVATDGSNFYGLKPGLYRAAADALVQPGSFTEVGSGFADGKIMGNGAARELYHLNTSSSRLQKVRVNEDFNDAAVLATYTFTPTAHLWRGGDHVYSLGSDAKVYDVTGETAVVVGQLPVSAGAVRAVTASSYTPSEVWVATSDGITAYDFSGGTGAATVKVATAALSPDSDYGATLQPSLMVPSTDGKRLYIATKGSSNFMAMAGRNYNPEVRETGLNYTDNWYYGFFTPEFITYVDEGGRMSDITVYNPLTFKGDRNSANAYAYTLWVQNALAPVIVGGDGMAENPAKPGEIWMGTTNEGLYKIVGNEDKAIFSKTLGNIPLNAYFGEQVPTCNFDREGNLWVYQNLYYPRLMMLPATKVNGDASAIKSADWLAAKDMTTVWQAGTEYIVSVMDTELAINRRGNREFIIVKPRYWANGMEVYERRSKGASVDDDVYRLFTTMVDQYGQEQSLSTITKIKEDNDGRIWILNQTYVAVVDDIEAFGADDGVLRVRRMVKKENQPNGTGLLITGNSPSDVTQSADGTVWISTEGSGVYRLNREADTVLEHYTTENSPLLSNIVGTICAHPSGAVFMGTIYGLVSYNIDSAPSATTLDDVKIIPDNPENPMWVSICNLTADAPVSIEDTNGNVVCAGSATGGTFMWDVLDTHGSRVAPGAYTVRSGAKRIGRIIIPG